MDSFNLTGLNRRADEAISACDSAIEFIKNISRQYPVDNHEPLSWENGKRSIVRYAEDYCDYCAFLAEVKEYTEGARKEFETSKRFSERYYKKCECLDHDIFQESNLFALKEFQPFLSPILDFIFYYEKGYEAAHPEKEE